MAFWYLQEGKLHNISGQPVPIRVKNTVCWCLDGSFSAPVCAHCLISWYWASLNKAWLCHLGTFLQVLMDIDEIPLSLLFSSWAAPALLASLSGEVLQALHHLRGPLLDSFQHVQLSLVLGVERKDHLIWPAGDTLPSAAQHCAGCFTARGCCWIMVLFCKAVFQLGSPQRILMPKVIYPQMQAFALLVCVAPHQSISVICHSPSGCQPSGALATTFSFLSSTNLLRVYYAPSSRSLIKILNRTQYLVPVVHCYLLVSS